MDNCDGYIRELEYVYLFFILLINNHLTSSPIPRKASPPILDTTRLLHPIFKMKTFTTTAILALMATLTQAAPVVDRSSFEAQITFIGAAGAQFSLSVPTDSSIFYIYNPLSISHISSEGGATCSFEGIDGSHTIVVGAETVDVGPPQTQVSGSCLAL